MKKLVYIIFFLSQVVYAQQETNYSQYMFNGISINPAFASSDKALNITTLYRKQWAQFKGAPQSKSILAHKYFPKKRTGLGFVAANHSSAVTKEYNFEAIYSYLIPIAPKRSLTLGISGGISSYSQDLTDLTLPQSINDPNFAADINSIIPKMDIGIHYQTQNFYTGLSASNLISSTNLNLNPRIVPHYYFSTGLLLRYSPQLLFKPQVLVKAASGTPVTFDAGMSVLLKEIVWLGAVYKHNNSVNGIIQMQINKEFKLGFAYDIISSKLSNVTAGSFEFSLNYRYLRNSARAMSPRYF